MIVQLWPISKVHKYNGDGQQMKYEKAGIKLHESGKVMHSIHEFSTCPINFLFYFFTFEKRNNN
jgi:hypothetical protein